MSWTTNSIPSKLTNIVKCGIIQLFAVLPLTFFALAGFKTLQAAEPAPTASPSATPTSVPTAQAPVSTGTISTGGSVTTGGSGNEITVTLFGQPCLLSGPFDKTILKNLHSISPEQTYPPADSAPTADILRKSIDKLKMAPNVPPAFDRYKERLIKRFEAQVKFADALAAARKAGKAEALITPLKPIINGKMRTKDFETLAKKIDTAKTADADLALQLLDVFNEMIEPDPEDDFHRTVQKMNIRYTCDFSDESEGEEEEESE